MSTVNDVKSVDIDGGEQIGSGVFGGSVSIEVPISEAVSVDLSADNTTSFVDVSTSGPQGAPGLKNVYIQSTDPSSTWGMEEKDYVWIQV